jgi:ketosteroid isomerase-like protein
MGSAREAGAAGPKGALAPERHARRGTCLGPPRSAHPARIILRRDTAWAMSEENVEIVRRLYDASAHRDSEAVLALYDPGVELDMSRAPCGDLVGQRFYHGHDGLRAFYREWYGAWETVGSDLEELIDAGERVVSVETTRGRGRESGGRGASEPMRHLDNPRRQDRSRGVVGRHARGSPRSRRAAGVGGVGGERRNRAGGLGRRLRQAWSPGSRSWLQHRGPRNDEMSPNV